MAPLDKCLLFHLKYHVEMERLYESDNPMLDGLPNQQETHKKIIAVGDAACRDAAELLEMCYRGIESHFSQFSKIRRGNSDPESTWQIKFRVTPRKTAKNKVAFGLYIDSYESTLGAWIWASGGRRAEDAIVAILGFGEKGAGLGGDWGTGNVRLAEIKIRVPELLDEPVDREPLVAEFQKVFEAITAQHIRELAGIAKNN